MIYLQSIRPLVFDRKRLHLGCLWVLAGPKSRSVRLAGTSKRPSSQALESTSAGDLRHALGRCRTAGAADLPGREGHRRGLAGRGLCELAAGHRVEVGR